MNSKTKIIAVISEKGGVGKTATLLNLAGALTVTCNKKVLAADLNPQQDLATNLGYVPDGNKTISELIRDQVDTFPIVTDDDKKHIIKHSDFGLDFMPATRQTLEYLPKIITESDKDCILNVFQYDMFMPYDYIFIDCKDSLKEHLVPQILTACDYVMPVAEVGINSLYDIAEVIKKISRLNNVIEIAGIVLNKTTSNSNISKEIIESVEEGFGEYLFDTHIPDRKAQIENANRIHRPCVIARKNGKKNTLAKYYANLAKEFLTRMGDEK